MTKYEIHGRILNAGVYEEADDFTAAVSKAARIGGKVTIRPKRGAEE